MSEEQIVEIALFAVFIIGFIVGLFASMIIDSLNGTKNLLFKTKGRHHVR